MPIPSQQRSILEYALKHLEASKNEIDSLIASARQQLGIRATAAPVTDSDSAPTRRGRKARKQRVMSAEARARVSEAQKKRWAAFHKAKKKAAKSA